MQILRRQQTYRQAGTDQNSVSSFLGDAGYRI
jgi:hypothetical protein